eukprot:5984274-Amphidinium_carterae.1
MDTVVQHPTIGKRHIDVIIVHPNSSQTLAAGSASSPGVAAKLGEQSKRRKYANITSLTPIAIETGGHIMAHIGQETKNFIRTMCKNSAQRTHNMVYHTLACPLQRGNAHLLLTSNYA